MRRENAYLLFGIAAGGLLLLTSAGVIVLKAADIARYASNAGFTGDDLITAVAIALAESGGNAEAVGDKTLGPAKGPSKGLWQINIGTKAHPEYANANLFDPMTNAGAAFSIYQRAGSSFREWATFDPRDNSTPRYLAYLDEATGAVQA